MGDEFSRIVDFEIRRNWSANTVIINAGNNIPKGIQAILTVGKGNTSHPAEAFVLIDKVDTRHLDLTQTLYEINAKLGKMIGSDLLIDEPSSFVNNKNGNLSRRDLVTGLRKDTISYLDAPHVFSSMCETRYGCTKCVEACPVNAITTDGHSVKIDESACTRCGICSASCPVSAVQMPRFSENAFVGLLTGLDKLPTDRKTLVFTCDASKVEPAPWIHVEEVSDVGSIGARHLTLAASSGLGAVIVYCADGSCSGKEKVRQAAEKIANILGTNAPIVAYLEGEKNHTKIRTIHEVSRSIPEVVSLTGKAWENYVKALKSLYREDTLAVGLGLTSIEVTDSCTLCEECVSSCPHQALKINNGSLHFDASSCTGCGYCATICPEHSITIKPLEHLNKLHARIVYKNKINKSR